MARSAPRDERVSARVERICARIYAVSFVPPMVHLEATERIDAAATPELVAHAADLALRAHEDLVATIVTSSTGVRLLGIRRASSIAPQTTPTLSETLGRFDGVLRILAE